ncbi:MAG: hypothetical protein ACOC44_13165 [Promethearchaeia archaeon]
MLDASIITLIVGLIISIISSTYFIVYIHFLNNDEYSSNLITLLISIAIGNAGIIYSTFFVISICVYFPEGNINNLLWKIGLIDGFISLALNTVLYIFLKEYKKIPLIPFIAFSVLFGILLGALLFPDSILFESEISTNNPILLSSIDHVIILFSEMVGLIIILFELIFIGYNSFLVYKIHQNSRNKLTSLGIILNSILYSFPVIMTILYILFIQMVFLFLHIILIWLTILSVGYVLIRKPTLFTLLTNKVYALNIYHKSGVLLYSYSFENSKEKKSDSAIWGNILIGLNYILSEFINSEDQIDVLQTKNYDIVVDYNNEYGFAVLVLTDKKNELIKKDMRAFSKQFSKKYDDELTEIQDLNKIINVSEFKETEKIIKENFNIYLEK